MIRKFFSNIITGRSFWRHANFSEVGELYAAKLMRTVAINLGSVFMSVYMLKNGYSAVAVSLFWASYFALKIVTSLPLAQFIAYIGSKKAILISNFLYIPSMVAFIFLSEIGVYALLVAILFQGASAALYDMAYNISFSRVKSVDKVGREMALMNIFDKIARGVTPLLGGLLAMFFDPKLSIVLSIVFFVIAAQPLMHTDESMKTGFKLAPKRFPWRMTVRSLLIQAPLGFEVYASGNAWGLFLATIIFTTSGNQVYAELGLLTSLILLISLGSTHMYGKLIDRKAGNQLLFWTVAGNIVVNILRAFTRTPAMAFGTNAAHEIAITGYSMATMRGMFDIADRSGYRVFYIGMVQLVSNFGASLSALLLAGALALVDLAHGFSLFYIATAVVMSLAMFSKFRIYSQS